MVHRLSRDQARRIAVQAQLLHLPRPVGVLDVVRRLGLLQHDHTAYVAPNAHLELWSRLADWVAVNDYSRQEILQQLRSEGPLPARELPDSTAVPWRSSGWTNHKSVGRLLDFLEARGEVAVSHRDGRERVWDLAERVYPDESSLPWEEASAERSRRRRSTA